MTYTNVNKVIEGDREMTARYAPLAKHFANMKELALLLNARAQRARLHRFRSARTGHRIRRPAAHDQHRAQRTQHRASPHRRIHAGRQSRRGQLSAAARASNRCIACTKSPTPKKFWNLKSWRAPSAIPSASKICTSAKSPCVTAASPRPRKRGRPDSYGHGRERGMKVSLPGRRRFAHHAAALPAPHSQIDRQARGTHHFLPDAAFSEAGALRRRAARALRARASTNTLISLRRFAAIPDLIVHRILKWALEHPHVKPPSRLIRSSRREPSARNTTKPSSIPTISSTKWPPKLPKPSVAPPAPNAN